MPLPSSTARPFLTARCPFSLPVHLRLMPRAVAAAPRVLAPSTAAALLLEDAVEAEAVVAAVDVVVVL